MVEGSRIRREFYITPGRIEGHGKRGKPLKADYVLEYRNHKLAAIEAKPFDEELTEGVGQACAATDIVVDALREIAAETSCFGRRADRKQPHIS